jgi:hypothetical protein
MAEQALVAGHIVRHGLAYMVLRTQPGGGEEDDGPSPQSSARTQP